VHTADTSADCQTGFRFPLRTSSHWEGVLRWVKCRTCAKSGTNARCCIVDTERERLMEVGTQYLYSTIQDEFETGRRARISTVTAKQPILRKILGINKRQALLEAPLPCFKTAFGFPRGMVLVKSRSTARRPCHKFRAHKQTSLVCRSTACCRRSTHPQESYCVNG
jgi:hypothetical protein